MVSVGMQTFRGVVSARDGDHHGHLTMAGWAGAVSDAVLAVFAAAELDWLESGVGPRLVEVEQRIQVLAAVEVGESIELMSGVIAVNPQSVTIVHLGVAGSVERSNVAHCWSVVAPTNANGAAAELSAGVQQRFERFLISESELLGG